jgi:hypothetical protein
MKRMFAQKIILKLLTASLLLTVVSFELRAQEQLEIHHINVENGDATFITVHNTANNTYSTKILIDGGNSGTAKFLEPYFTNLLGSANVPFRLNYLILSHFHQDHYAGLVGLKDGDVFTADSLIDPGGYALGAGFGLLTPPDSVNDKGAGGAGKYIDAIKEAFEDRLLAARSKIITSFPRDIGKGIVIGSVNGVPLTLGCIAGAGYSLGTGGAVVNNMTSFPTRTNPNNYTLGFVLQCGEFRYFTGGDMGGYDSGGCNYLDQETTVDKGLVHIFPNKSFPFDANVEDTVSSRGHVCAFKVSHHGSDCSSNNQFLTLTAAAAFISSGNMSKWGLPVPAFATRLNANLVPMSSWDQTNLPLGVSNQGFYFTNLYNFTSGSMRNSRSACITEFGNTDGVNFSYGNDYDALGNRGNNQYQSRKVQDKDSYVLVLNAANITTQSVFTVYRVNFNKNPTTNRMSAFQCHKSTAQ